MTSSFISSLKTLFSLLDEEGKGSVKLSDIESRWETNNSLPRGVLDNIRNFTPPSGRLSFEEFSSAVQSFIEYNSRTKPDQQRKDRTGSQKVKSSSRSSENLTLSTLHSDNETHFHIRPMSQSAAFSTRSVPFQADGVFRPIKTDDNDKVNAGGDASFPTVRRRDSRRHTLGSGVDHNMVRQIQQLQQEKDMLSKGLIMVEHAREWYNTRIKTVDDRLRSTGTRNFFGDRSLEAQRERLQLEMLRVEEVNNQLQALIESTEKGLPIHMGLALTRSPQTKLQQKQSVDLERLMTQNQTLAREVNMKTERISQLERDKAQLIRKMFKAKSENECYQSDTTFI